MEGFEFLIEKEELWAKMLMDVLKDNGNPCVSFPVHGAALVIKAGMQESLQVFVPEEFIERAKELVDELFLCPADENSDEEFNEDFDENYDED